MSHSSKTTQAVVVDAVRTPVGRRNGLFSGHHPTGLLAGTLAHLVDHAGIEPEQLDDLTVGCGLQHGEQAHNVGRCRAGPRSLPVLPEQATVGASTDTRRIACDLVSLRTVPSFVRT